MYSMVSEKKRSCESQLLITIHDFAKAINDGKQMDLVLLDFSKAFNKVDHRKLCLQSSHYSIKEKCLGWITAFLSVISPNLNKYFQRTGYECRQL